MRSPSRNTSEATRSYAQRVNRAIDYVLRHMDQPLKLEIVANAAGFSSFHFHRVFRASVGETLSQFVKRVRLERAVKLLSHEPGRSLTDVALECGFGSSSDFSRSFKQRYGVPPSAFDVGLFRKRRREEWLEGISDPCHRIEEITPSGNPDGFAVELLRLPARRVVYIRVHDPYRPHVVERAANDLIAWAEDRGLADGQWLGYMWDDPEIVAREKCRYDVGLVVEQSEETQPDSEVCSLDFPPMRVAQVEVLGPIDLEIRALDWLFRTWLPASGFVPSDQPCFEAWMGRPFEHGKNHFELHAQLPIVSAQTVRRGD